MTQLQFFPRSLPSSRPSLAIALGLTGALLLSACGSNADWDLRSGDGALDTSAAALNATNPPPAPDARGVISYPGYQVAVARKGDTVASVAARVGLQADALARYNALKPTDPLRAGEVLALPSRVAAAPTPTAATGGTGAIIGSTATPGSVDVATIATTALDRIDSTTPAAAATPAKPAAPAGAEPIRYQVKRGETAFSIARSFNISVKALAEWNGLDENLDVREGQYLIIPTISAKAPDPVAANTEPGQGSPTPLPPSSKEPLPAEKTKTAAEVEKEVPASPDMGAQRTAASAAVLAMPLAGKIIRPYDKAKNDGIDISAAAGTPVKAAADGTVALITTDTKGTPIIVIRHADGLLTGYAGVDGVKVAKGDAVKRGQVIAVLRPGDPAFLHFAVRKGNDSVDPMAYLQ